MGLNLRCLLHLRCQLQPAAQPAATALCAAASQLSSLQAFNSARKEEVQRLSCLLSQIKVWLAALPPQHSQST
jgi:hypothetical protein